MKSYPATVSYISDKAEFTPKVIQTREERVKLVYKVEAICDNDGSLKIGMPIEIIF
jgi:HlyD family secretion protein